MNSILKDLLRRISLAVISFIIRQYIDLDFIKDFNLFSSETKEYFNGNNSQGSSINPPSEGEGSNRQNNAQDSNINLPSFKEVVEQAGSVSKEELIEVMDKLYEKNSETFAQDDKMSEEILKIAAEREQSTIEAVLLIKERESEINERIKDFEDWKNQSQLNRSMIDLSDMKRKIDEDVEALNVDKKKVSDKFQADTAEVKKMYEDTVKLVGEKLKKNIDEVANDE